MRIQFGAKKASNQWEFNAGAKKASNQWEFNAGAKRASNHWDFSVHVKRINVIIKQILINIVYQVCHPWWFPLGRDRPLSGRWSGCSAGYMYCCWWCWSSWRWSFPPPHLQNQCTSYHTEKKTQPTIGIFHNVTKTFLLQTQILIYICISIF